MRMKRERRKRRGKKINIRTGLTEENVNKMRKEEAAGGQEGEELGQKMRSGRRIIRRKTRRSRGTIIRNYFYVLTIPVFCKSHHSTKT
jgi:hypothetical protein